MTEIEIPDAPAPQSDESPPSSGRSVLVPLVVVPALIVMVIVLVFVLFSAITGHEDSPRENLERLLRGGANERQQAAFNLVRQVLEARGPLNEGGQHEWNIDESFLPELRAARSRIGELEEPDDVPIPLVLSSILAQLGDSEGVVQLAEMTALPETLDPEGEYRFYAAGTLAAISGGLGEKERERVADALIALLDSPDPGLVLVSIAGLQNVPSPRTVPALQGVLASSVLEQRASAALSLAALGDPSGREVLHEMLLPEVYAEERARDERKWPPQRVSESRRKALQALIALGIPPERAEFERWAEDDPDPEVREAARAFLADRGE